MKALILNSGTGSRMGILTREHPKCMTQILGAETILSRQLKQLKKTGIIDIVITSGFFDSILIDYCKSLKLDLKYTFINNPLYDQTNYIYSIYLAKNALDDDILLMHGDLIFEDDVLNEVIANEESCMTVSSTIPLPQKDFKAVVSDNQILKVGVDFFEMAVAAQPLYKLLKEDWKVWLSSIGEFCKAGIVKCYAENAFNVVSDKCRIYALDVKNALCSEIDTVEDLVFVKKYMEAL